jgi:hypothetical protein
VKRLTYEGFDDGFSHQTSAAYVRVPGGEHAGADAICNPVIQALVQAGIDLGLSKIHGKVGAWL